LKKKLYLPVSCKKSLLEYVNYTFFKNFIFEVLYPYRCTDRVMPNFTLIGVTCYPCGAKTLKIADLITGALHCTQCCRSAGN